MRLSNGMDITVPILPANNFETWFREWLEVQSEGYESEKEVAAEISQHGIDSGYPDLTYTDDTVALYAKYKADIWEVVESLSDEEMSTVLSNIADRFHIDDVSIFENAMVWTAVELLAQAIADEAEEDFSDLDGDTPEEADAESEEDEE